MRIFEIGLLVVNALSLLIVLRRRSKLVWLGLAGINLALLGAHGVYEGLRYQMIFSYLCAAGLGLVALVKLAGGFAASTRPLIKILLTGLGLLALGLSAFLSAALPVFSLPKPTGSEVVGVEYVHLVDKARSDPFLEGAQAHPRELMVKIYYPARPDSSKPYLRYFNGDPDLTAAFSGFYNLPGFAFSQLTLVKTHTKAGLPISNRAASYPVILFSHGAGTSMEVQTAQCEDLASHGYIVAAIDHPYVSAATAFPDRLALHHEATTDFKTAEPAEIITQIMADDARFVIDQLARMNDGEVHSIFAGRMDLEQLGAMGHSVGGAVAYQLALEDPRVKAAVNLDGAVYVTPRKEPSASTAPVLMLANDQYHAQAIARRQPLMPELAGLPDVDQQIQLSIYGGKAGYQAAYNKARQNVTALAEVLKNSGGLYTITGSDHMKFTDIGLFIGVDRLRELLNIRGETSPARCLQISAAVSLAFFDQHLKGASGDTLSGLLDQYPELKNVPLQ